MGESQKTTEVDMTLPRSKRRMIGFDIEQWRGENHLTRYEAQTALGFRNSIHYNKMCEGGLLPPTVEILIRLYDLVPIPPKYTLRELFVLMYGPALLPFKGTDLETYAEVDLGSRFTRIFDRSPERRYEWLKETPTKNAGDIAAYTDVNRVLAKLKDFAAPGEVLEEVAKQVWSFRGVDLDTEYPIPTTANPPQRKKTGRKGRPPEEVAREKKQKQKARAKKARLREAQKRIILKARLLKTADSAKAKALRELEKLERQRERDLKKQERAREVAEKKIADKKRLLERTKNLQLRALELAERKREREAERARKAADKEAAKKTRVLVRKKPAKPRKKAPAQHAVAQESGSQE